MNAPATQLSAQEHIARASDHSRTTSVMFDEGNEWFSVCAFYAAYHTLKAALHQDPVFSSVVECSKVDPRLTISAPNATHHQGGPSREAGLNEIARMVYPKLSGRYIRLHMASVNVRYHRGLKDVYSEQVLMDDLRAIETCFNAGAMVYGSPETAHRSKST